MKFYEMHFYYANLVIFLLFTINFLKDRYSFSNSQVWM